MMPLDNFLPYQLDCNRKGKACIFFGSQYAQPFHPETILVQLVRSGLTVTITGVYAYMIF